MNIATFPGKDNTPMPRKKYLIHLTDEERQKLLDLTRKGTAKARQFKRAMILLKANDGMHDTEIMAALDVSRPCVERIRKRFASEGLEKALFEDPRPGQKRKMDGSAEAFLIATAQSQAPNGHKHWSLRLLAEKVIESGVVDNISYETIRRVLKNSSITKNDQKPGQKQILFQPAPQADHLDHPSPVQTSGNAQSLPALTIIDEGRNPSRPETSEMPLAPLPTS
jgi:transposase